MARLFFALQPSPAQQAAMHDIAAPLLRDLGARPVPAADLHLTLCFLGEVTEAQDEALAQAMRQVGGTAVDFRLDRADWWRTSQVLCLLPAEGPASDLPGALAATLREVARSAGIATDPRPFRAHVTVGRKVHTAAASARRWPLPLARPLEFSSAAVALMRSTGRGEGPRYTVHRQWPGDPGQ